jgi:hypothetical protein
MKSSMPCRFCDHANPAGSRFCNACGSPLDLGPCPHCEAVNNALADRCYQCGQSLKADDDHEVAEVGANAVLAARSASKPDGALPAPDSIPVALSQRFDDDVHDREPVTRGSPRRHALRERVIDEDVAVDRRPDAVVTAREPRRAYTRHVHAALFGITLAVVAAGAYYAYVNGMASAVMGMSERAVSAHRSTPAPVPVAPPTANPQAGEAAPPKPAVAGSASTIPPSPSPATAAAHPPSSVSPSEASKTATGNRPAPAAVKESPEAPAPAASHNARQPPQAFRPAGRDAPGAAAQRGNVDRDAIETQRLIARDLAGFVHPPVEAAPAPR